MHTSRAVALRADGTVSSMSMQALNKYSTHVANENVS
jgi:hypothetical protein